MPRYVPQNGTFQPSVGAAKVTLTVFGSIASTLLMAW